MAFSDRYGPWALVAGASEGLGAAWAHGVASRGVNVLLVARRPEALERTANEVRARHGVEVRTLVLDLGAASLTEALAPSLQGREIGLYIHNAAFVPEGEFLSRPAEDQARSLDVNCRAPILLCHALGARMAERGRGGIVLMSSLTAFQGTPLLATYGATKAFNLALAEALHAELSPRGIDVMAVCAGATRTPGFLRSMPEGAPGQLEPEAVVQEALRQLGRRPFMIPGAFNRFASWAMRRLLSRARTVKLLEAQARKVQRQS